MPQVQVTEQLSRIVCVTESKTLPDRSIVFECTCGKTVGRIVVRDGYRKLKIMLTGRTVLEPAADMPSIVDGKLVPAGTRGASQKFEEKPKNCPYFDLGGRCPQCNKRVQIGLRPVLQAVGFDGLRDFQETCGLPLTDDYYTTQAESFGNTADDSGVMFVSSLAFIQFVLDEVECDEKPSDKQKVKKTA